MSYKHLLPLMVICFLLSGCLTQTIKISARYPAKHTEASELTHISVFDFSGNNADEFESLLAAELSNASLDNQRYFTMTSGDLLKSRSGERSITLDENLSSGLEVARRLGVEGVYVGNLSKLDVTSITTNEEREECTEYKNLFSCKKGKKRTVKVKCYEQKALLTADVQLINSMSGGVVYSDTITRNANHSYCLDGSDSSTLSGEYLSQKLKGSFENRDVGSRKMTNNEFSRLLMGSIAEQVRKDVAPYNGTMEVSLKSDTKQIESPYTDNFKSAMAFANSRQITRACGIWNEIYAKSTASRNAISLIFNLGVCAESIANFDRAIAMYSQADSLLTTPDKQITEAKKRAMTMKRNQIALAK